MRLLPDAVRLALGTLTAVRVPPPRHVDRGIAGWAMAQAPAVGGLLALVVAGPLGLLSGARVGSPLLLATLAVAALALLTRGMHLDGLADTADGLGSARPAPGALEVMRASDVGPFGVVTLVLSLGLQVAALATCVSAGVGGAALAVALVVGRLALAFVCLPVFPSARPDGLGATVAGSLRGARPAVAVAVVLVVVPAVLVLSGATGSGAAGVPVGALMAGLLGLAPALLLARHCTRRLGGVTGDVLGAVVEVGTTGALVATALLLR